MMQSRPSLFAVIFALFVLAASASAQKSRPPDPLPPGRDASQQRPDRRSPFGSPHEEMLERAAIKYDEQEHRETVERAKEGARLSTELRLDFERNKSLTRDDLKKLERLEKIARRIRKRAGGSDDDNGLENPPNNLETALPRLASVADELNKGMEKISRHVVSTGIIEHSNEMIELIRHIRSFIPK
jgi:hypothetical protein